VEYDPVTQTIRPHQELDEGANQMALVEIDAAGWARLRGVSVQGFEPYTALIATTSSDAKSGAGEHAGRYFLAQFGEQRASPEASE
jgi:hypothetical protein